MIIPAMPHPRTLLVVEDEAHLRDALQAAFRALLPPDWHCVPCRSAEDALRVLEARPVDALLTDNDLPGAPGVELLAAIAAGWPTIRRGLMTGRLTPAVRTAVAVIGEVYLLEKPFTLDELRAWIVRLLDVGREER